MLIMDIQSLIDVDRYVLSWFNGSNSIFLDNWMVLLTSGLTWIPLYLSLFYLVVKNNETMSQILLVVGCVLGCVILSDGVADFIVKPMVERWRPSNDPIFKYTISVVNGMRGSDYGFFSAHASNTFSIALFFCMLVKSRVLSVSLVLWSLVNCYTRMYLGFHYPSDIICGIAWGAIVALVMYYSYCRIYKALSFTNNYVSTQYTSTGYSLDDVDVVELVLLSTLLLTVIMSLFTY